MAILLCVVDLCTVILSYFVIFGKSAGSKTHSHSLSDAGQAQIGIGSTATVLRQVPTANFPGNASIPSAGTTSYNWGQGAALRGATDSASSLQPYQTTNYIVKI